MLRLMLLAGLGAAATAQAAQPAPATSDFFAGESLGELTRYRVYPLVDRALRDNAAGRYASASALLQQALNIAPDSQAIRLALARTLMLQGRFGQVETILRPLDARSSSVAGLLLESRLKRLAGHPLPSPQTVHDWLASSPAALQPRYAEAVLDTLARQDRSADAGRYLAPWLKELAQHDLATARQMQARLAQGRQDWPAAIAQWQALAQQRPLTPAETLDYGYALLAAGEAETAARLLTPETLATPRGRILAQDIAARASALGQPALASQTLEMLDQVEPLAPAQLGQGLENALASHNMARARQLAGRLATRADAAQLPLLLEAWARLDDWPALRAFQAPTPQLAARQQALLLEHALHERQFDAVLEQVPASTPPASPTFAARLQALQATGQREAAARGWLARYQAARTPQALEQASFLLAETGNSQAAARLLQSALPFDSRRDVLTTRLLTLYQAEPALASAADLDMLGRQPLSPSQRIALAELWRLRNDCEAAESVLAPVSPLPARAALVLGHCQAPRHPGIAIGYFEAARATDPQAANRALAELYARTGDAALAVAAWQALPPDTLTASDRLSAARGALAAGDPALADGWWQAAGLSQQAGWYATGAAIAEAQGRLPLAQERWQQARMLAPQDAADAYAAGELARKMQQPQAARQALADAVRLAPDNPAYRAALGFALAETDPALAAANLAAAKLPGASAFPVDEALTYLYARLGDNREALLAQHRALELAPDYLALQPADEAAAREYALRTVRSDLERRWSLGINGWIGSQAAPGEWIAGTPNPAGSPKNSLEINGEWRLGEQPVDNNCFTAITARLIAEGSSGDPLPGQSRWLGIGLRTKPLSGQNLYLSVERLWQVAGAGKENDWLVRASASFLDQGRWRPEWHAEGPGWWQQSLYLDAARWLVNDHYTLLARYTLGYNHKLSQTSAQVVQPYALLQAQKTDAGRDARAGLGLAWRGFFAADHDHSYRQQQQLKLEWQTVLDSTLAHGNGWFLRYEGSW